MLLLRLDNLLRMLRISHRFFSLCGWGWGRLAGHLWCGTTRRRDCTIPLSARINFPQALRDLTPIVGVCRPRAPAFLPVTTWCGGGSSILPELSGRNRERITMLGVGLDERVCILILLPLSEQQRPRTVCARTFLSISSFTSCTVPSTARVSLRIAAAACDKYSPSPSPTPTSASRCRSCSIARGPRFERSSSAGMAWVPPASALCIDSASANCASSCSKPRKISSGKRIAIAATSLRLRSIFLCQSLWIVSRVLILESQCR